MVSHTHRDLERQAASRLAELLDLPGDRAQHEKGVGTDFVLQAGALTFVVQCKSSGTAAAVFQALDQVQRAASKVRRAVPLVAVPYMGPTGRRRCEAAGVGWLDLSGNAHISAPGIRIFIEGQPNRFRYRGRPSSAFAPKSSRITRFLLMHPEMSFSQRDLARESGLGEGFTSRIVSRLLESGLVTRESNRIRVYDANRLLDAWGEVYEFSRHHLIQGHVPARSSEALLHQLSEAFGTHRQSYAATGLAAAWLFNRFAGFRIVSLYLAKTPSPQMLKRISFNEDARGANVWLMVPDDEGVFDGASDVEGVRCVHPVQAYLDLKAHPERAAEGAQKLRSELLH